MILLSRDVCADGESLAHQIFIAKYCAIFLKKEQCFMVQVIEYSCRYVD